MKLSELRKARGGTQEALALAMGTTQGQISRIERQPDVKHSTITRYVEGLGGRVEIIVTFPGGDMYVINLGEKENEQ